MSHDLRSRSFRCLIKRKTHIYEAMFQINELYILKCVWIVFNKDTYLDKNRCKRDKRDMFLLNFLQLLWKKAKLLPKQNLKYATEELFLTHQLSCSSDIRICFPMLPINLEYCKYKWLRYIAPVLIDFNNINESSSYILVDLPKTTSVCPSNICWVPSITRSFLSVIYP